MAPKVLCTRILPPAAQRRLEAQGFDLVQWKKDTAMPREELLANVAGVDAVICLLSDQINDELLDHAGPQLKTIATMSVGYDHIDVDAVRARGIHIGYTPDVLTDATADLTVLLTLAAARRMKEGIRAAENGEWGEWRPTWLLGSQFTGKTLGVIGLGRIGEAVAKRLQAFGIQRTLYWGRKERPNAVNAEFASLDELLAQSDYVVVCAALTRATKHMLNYDAFKKMKRTAVFVNTARGGIVQQDDLVRALEENLIASCGLDVTTPEPLPTDHRLYQFPNCTILPHIASATIETREKMADMCVDNVLAGLSGAALPFAVPDQPSVLRKFFVY
ncbi:D-isomer specific 2-hydroxyacid dehydrogenase [Radiomyces spectabilis]|uniref:D-isomer specific 2-hydroxyacid dehydrogenase n=1 Tax=Radiomyces spectabilis TaxID=64574 RepID=UPI00221FE114|nr:D-isomer specific 2-hydroxyacid dehydrogenase [Radiomyces spectabilis]KAI8393764.1 D-isomer specific 2-hydroxyacid dehydrogenase [Radiomyces spectabilis]